MKKMFIKNYKEKHHIKRYSGGFYLACLIELVAIILMAAGIIEIELYNKTNPASFLIQFGGLLFCFGSFVFAKLVKVK